MVKNSDVSKKEKMPLIFFFIIILGTVLLISNFISMTLETRNNVELMCEGKKLTDTKTIRFSNGYQYYLKIECDHEVLPFKYQWESYCESYDKWGECNKEYKLKIVG